MSVGSEGGNLDAGPEVEHATVSRLGRYCGCLGK